MKKDEYTGMALPVCIGLGVALGAALDNIPVGIGIGAGLGVVLSACGLFREKDSENENGAE